MAKRNSLLGKISGKDKKYLFVTVTEKLPAPLWLTRSFFRIGNFYALKFLNYTVIFLQHASARAPGPMWQATLKDSGSI